EDPRAGRLPLRATGGHATADRDDGRRAHARGPRSKPVRAVRGGRAFRGDDRHSLLAAFRLRERLRPALRVEKAGGDRGAKPLQWLELPERETIRTPRLAGRLLLRQRERPAAEVKLLEIPVDGLDIPFEDVRRRAWPREDLQDDLPPNLREEEGRHVLR